MAGGVLIVEDDEDIRADLAAILRLKGYRVDQAANGHEALVRMARELPSVVLLDLMMPEMNGWELRAIMLDDALLRAVPVVVVSGAGKLDEAAATLDAAAVLPKPFELAHLFELVERFCPRAALSAVR
jgi:DNA-binding response OmpR family regulator